MSKKKKPERGFKTALERLWFFHFTDATNPDTFLKPGPSAIAAGYKCKNKLSYDKQGYKVKVQLAPMVDGWLDEVGLSEQTLKLKLVSLLEAKETKLVSMKGGLTDQSEGTKQVAVSSQSKVIGGADGFREYQEEHTLVAIDVENLSIQEKVLTTALKIKGMLKEEVNVTGLEGLADRIVEARKRSGGAE